MSDPSAGPPEAQDLVARMPYAIALGIRIDEATPALTVGTLDWSPERGTVGGILHGGAIMSLARRSARSARSSTTPSELEPIPTIRLRGCTRPLRTGSAPPHPRLASAAASSPSLST